MIHLKEDCFSEFVTNEDLLVFLFICANVNDNNELILSQKELIEGARLNITKGRQLNNILNRLVEQKKITISNEGFKSNYSVCEPSKVIFRTGSTPVQKSTPKPNPPSPKPKKETKPTEELSAYDIKFRDTYPNVYKMAKRLTYDEWMKLVSEGYTNEEIKNMLYQLDNYKRNNKPCYMCYQSALLTLRNWLKNERQRGNT